MELYIRIKDGSPFEHPILGENFCQAFPNVDVNNLPPEFARFERIAPPTLGIYEVLVSNEPTYEFIDGTWKDVWIKRDMTVEEKAIKQQTVRNEFNSREYAENWSAWILDEATCIMVPPISRPESDQVKIDAGIYTVWSGVDSNWKETPVRPDGEYKFNYILWQWVPVVNEA